MVGKSFFRRRTKAGVGLAVLVLLLLAGFIIFSRRTTEVTESDGEARFISRQLLTKVDTDGDGLTDWEEILYHTDAQKEDSDGDGTKDGEEVNTGRHPLQKGPGDTISRTDGGEGYARISLSGENNLTATILENFLQTKTIPEIVNPQQQELLMAEFRNYLAPLGTDLPQFQEEDVPDATLVIREEGSAEVVRNYFNAVTVVYATHLQSLKNKDMEIIAHTLEKNDTAPLKQFAAYRFAIGKATEEIKKIPVPRRVLRFHKKELWYLKITAAQTETLERIQLDDPIQLLALLQIRVAFKKSMSEFHAKEIPAWLKENHITLLPKDAALLLYPSS